ncbi:ATP-grasp domain-containing protein [Pseudomonadaceae bacterium T75]|uniref:ATP-grasp domain-containing protein n=1 Tax=Stutzerimonas nitrititolerans TaxID=2482751 RepID=UPI001482E3CC|nr:ATP-grasp domain-containing protein [Stutzerimonas nitrititolerans]NNT95953.1 carbamoyl-phosphate synthase large subunit [Stutzerimonas nitrititolerans]WAD27708.1 ATP-grasp domain-containing protein [Pseudomonadaceae bacterium T75]
MSRVRVLVFPSGSEVGLEIAQALQGSVHVDLYGASSRCDHGALAFVRHAEVPNIAELDFDARFARLLSEWHIDLVFSTHDSVQEYLAPRIGAWGASLVNGDSEAARLARSKSATYRFFGDLPWVPRTYAGAGLVDNWPVVVKPDQGQGGQGVCLVHTPVELTVSLGSTRQPVICEYLPGAELTVDCFTDRHGRLLYLGPRSRERIVGGIAMCTRRMGGDAQVRSIGEAINRCLRLRGPWFFQLKRDAQGDWKLLEMSCRLSSSSVAQRAAGVNLALMAVQDHMGRDLTVLEDPRVLRAERRLTTSIVLDYDFDTACFDLDDTLLCDGIANPSAMRLVYRLLQLGKRLVLLTRHPSDPLLTLEAAHIPATLFERIVHLRQSEPKSAHIPLPAIFIDNHFPERIEVSRSLRIPVFNVDALDLLFP